MVKNESTIIIGNGEIGTALYKVLFDFYQPLYTKDMEDFYINNIKWMHICYPYSNHFIKNTKKYISEYKPKYTIIHSTIPLGTTEKIDKKNIWHSPIRGKHPNLALGIKTFIKYIGGEYNAEVMNYFKDAEIKTVYTENPRTTELGKLLDTAYYGWNIVFCKEVEKLCKKYGADFSVVYTQMNRSYNEGYGILQSGNFIRPVLQPIAGKIGGHCIIPNCKLLKETICNLILKFNKQY